MERLTQWVWEARDHEVIVLVYEKRFRLVKDDMNFTSGLEIDLIDKRTRERVRNRKELADYVRRFSDTVQAVDDTILFDFENAVWKQIQHRR